MIDKDQIFQQSFFAESGKVSTQVIFFQIGKIFLNSFFFAQFYGMVKLNLFKRFLKITRIVLIIFFILGSSL